MKKSIFDSYKKRKYRTYKTKDSRTYKFKDSIRSPNRLYYLIL